MPSSSGWVLVLVDNLPFFSHFPLIQSFSFSIFSLIQFFILTLSFFLPCQNLPIYQSAMAVPMSMFQNLPLNLAQMIFQHLRRSPALVYSLSLTCRRFHIVATPLLYSSICLMDPVSSGQLARTLRQSSWLCRLTVELQVHFHDKEMDQSYEPLLSCCI
jgi:hypothetical protein